MRSLELKVDRKESSQTLARRGGSSDASALGRKSSSDTVENESLAALSMSKEHYNAMPEEIEKSLSALTATMHFVESDARASASLAFCFVLPSSSELVKMLAPIRLLDLFQYATQEGLSEVLTASGGAVFAEAMLPLYDETVVVLMVS